MSRLGLHVAITGYIPVARAISLRLGDGALRGSGEDAQGRLLAVSGQAKHRLRLRTAKLLAAQAAEDANDPCYGRSKPEVSQNRCG